MHQLLSKFQLQSFGNIKGESRMFSVWTKLPDLVVVEKKTLSTYHGDIARWNRIVLRQSILEMYSDDCNLDEHRKEWTVNWPTYSTLSANLYDFITEWIQMEWRFQLCFLLGLQYLNPIWVLRSFGQGQSKIYKDF